MIPEGCNVERMRRAESTMADIQRGWGRLHQSRFARQLPRERGSRSLREKKKPPDGTVAVRTSVRGRCHPGGRLLLPSRGRELAAAAASILLLRQRGHSAPLVLCPSEKSQRASPCGLVNPRGRSARRRCTQSVDVHRLHNSEEWQTWSFLRSTLAHAYRNNAILTRRWGHTARC